MCYILQNINANFKCMKNHDLNLKFFVFGSVFIVCWILGALRFQWDFIS